MVHNRLGLQGPQGPAGADGQDGPQGPHLFHRNGIWTR